MAQWWGPIRAPGQDGVDRRIADLREEAELPVFLKARGIEGID